MTGYRKIEVHQENLDALILSLRTALRNLESINGDPDRYAPEDTDP